TQIRYDPHSLLVEEVEDPLGNIVRADNDYRTLRPKQVTDANGNRQAVAFDALGLVAGTTVMGKEGEPFGDTLIGFQPNLPHEVIQRHLAERLPDPSEVLGAATTRVITDMWRYYRAKKVAVSGMGPGKPIIVATVARETHHADLGEGQVARIR